MHTSTANGIKKTEVGILARILGNDQGQLPADMARYILTLGFGDRDKERMHALAVRNQDDGLTPAEKEELFAYAKAGSLLSLLRGYTESCSLPKML